MCVVGVDKAPSSANHPCHCSLVQKRRRRRRHCLGCRISFHQLVSSVRKVQHSRSSRRREALERPADHATTRPALAESRIAVAFHCSGSPRHNGQRARLKPRHLGRSLRVLALAGPLSDTLSAAKTRAPVSKLAVAPRRRAASRPAAAPRLDATLEMYRAHERERAGDSACVDAGRCGRCALDVRSSRLAGLAHAACTRRGGCAGSHPPAARKRSAMEQARRSTLLGPWQSVGVVDERQLSPAALKRLVRQPEAVGPPRCQRAAWQRDGGPRGARRSRRRCRHVLGRKWHATTVCSASGASTKLKGAV